MRLRDHSLTAKYVTFNHHYVGSNPIGLRRFIPNFLQKKCMYVYKHVMKRLLADNGHRLMVDRSSSTRSVSIRFRLAVHEKKGKYPNW